MVAVLFNAGDQVPVMPFNEVVGNGDKVVPAQIAATGLKIGVFIAAIVTDAVLITAGQPPVAAMV